MRFPTGFLLLASGVAFVTHALALTVRLDDVDVAGRDLGTASVKSDVVSFDYVGSEVMAPHDVELVRRAGWTYRNNQALIIAIIAKNAFVINATCSSGNVYTCAAGVTYSVFTFFFAAWFWADRRADGPAGGEPFFAIAPTPAKTLRERLTTELAAGQWHYVGHVAHGGVNHTVHYLNHGTGVHQLQARETPFWNATAGDGAGGTLGARQLGQGNDEDNDGGFVGDYYWNKNNEGAYDSFHSTSDGTSFFAANAAGYMINSQQAIAACAGFSDADGPLDNGILTYGWNGQRYNWGSSSALNSAFDGCESALGD